MRFVVIILSVLLFGCDVVEVDFSNADFKAEQLAGESTLKTFKLIKMKTGLLPFGHGGRISNGIITLFLSFKCYKEINVEQARVLLIKAVEEFAEIVNADKRIHPYLKDGYPFRPKNIEIVISLNKPDGSLPGPSEMWIVTAKEGILKYKFNDPKEAYKSIIISETYEEAVQKIREAAVERAKPKTAF